MLSPGHPTTQAESIWRYIKHLLLQYWDATSFINCLLQSLQMNMEKRGWARVAIYFAKNTPLFEGIQSNLAEKGTVRTKRRYLEVSHQHLLPGEQMEQVPRSCGLPHYGGNVLHFSLSCTDYLTSLVSKLGSSNVMQISALLFGER